MEPDCKSTVDAVLSEHLREDVERLWDYHRLDDELRPVEVGIGFGSHDLGVATHIADLYHRGLFPLAVFTGANAPTTLEVFPRGEAVHYREHALELGVPDDAILIDPEATNTAENLTKTRDLLAHHGLAPSSAIIVSRPYQQRRIRATARKIWPELEVLCTSLPLALDDYLRLMGDTDKVINMLVGDTHRIIEYPYPPYEFAAPEAIPEPVLRSYSDLVRRGYTRRLLVSD